MIAAPALRPHDDRPLPENRKQIGKLELCIKLYRSFIDIPNPPYVFSAANVITGATSSATLTPSTSSETITLANNNTIATSSGYTTPELASDSGSIIYLENRKPIQRDSDQTEDIKLIIEF